MNDPMILADVWFDVRCPWCFIGARRLDAAVDRFAVEEPTIGVTVRHHSYELAPGIPERYAGGEAEYLLEYEGVPLEQSRRDLPAMRRLAAAEGVELRFDELNLVNTRKAHRVFQLARSVGVGEQLVDRLFRAYFTECLDLADDDVLVALGTEVGLEAAEVRAAADPELAADWDAAVTAEHVRGQMLGAMGTPFAMFNAKYRVPGAQTAEVFTGVLREVARRDFPDT